MKNSDLSANLKVAVLAGGIGSERNVSIQSGKAVSDALRQAGVSVVLSDITPDNTSILDDSSIDVFFPALHGQFGEDGKLQRIMEEKSLTYTGSDSAASELAFDKVASKKMFETAAIKTPPSVMFSKELTEEEFNNNLSSADDKYVVKPVRQGSSVGISIVEGCKNALRTANKTEQKFGDTMIETYISGREITVGIIDGEPLDIIEIKPVSGFYDYRAKYDDEKTGFVFDTIKDEKLKTDIKQAGVKCFEVLGCRHFARVDFILKEDDFYVLEVNTIPGFTSHSLLPMAAKRAGLDMPELCSKILELALK
jgi:D-alanine-D-alanine ligase